MVNRSGNDEKSKSKKPYDGFPLFAHRNGQWAKKIRGKMHYFGVLDDPQAALDRYLAEKDNLHAGRPPKPREEEIKLKDIVNKFLAAKKARVESGELSDRSWADYYTTGLDLCKRFGRECPVDHITTQMFAEYRVEMTKRWGSVRVNNEIQRVRCIFKYAFDAGVVATPTRFGPGFAPATKKTLRKEKADKPKRLFQAETLRTVLAAAGKSMKPMVLLAINAGFGNQDLGCLPLKALDLENGWLEFPRPKTGIARRCKLWPETADALRLWLPNRPKVKNQEDDDLVFITKYGSSFREKVNTERMGDEMTSSSRTSAIGHEFDKLLKRLGLKQPGVGFYAIRHTFRTIAGRAKDKEAADHVMGHEVAHMSSVYVENIDDHRLEAVADVVHEWLFPDSRNMAAPRVLLLSTPLPALPAPSEVIEGEIV